MQRLYRSRIPHGGRGRKRDNKEIGCRGYTDQEHHRGRKNATMKRAGAEAIQIKGAKEGGEGRQ